MTGATCTDFKALSIENVPKGPALAIINSHIILILVIDAIWYRTMPTAMQWAGLQRNTSAGADNLTCVQKPETYLMNCAILREI